MAPATRSRPKKSSSHTERVTPAGKLAAKFAGYANTPLADLRKRAERIVQRDLGFISNPLFKQPAAEREILGEQAAPSRQISPVDSGNSQRATRGLPRALVRLCEDPLLSHGDEQMMFRRMNYLKFLASDLVERLDLDHPDESVVEKLEALIAESDEIRNRIITANGRLVMSIVKNLVDAKNSFDELMSEGMDSVMRAVDKFDFARGYRFSTFATLVIRRDLYRLIQRHQKHRTRFVSASQEGSLDTEDEREAELDQRRWDELTTALGKVLECLDPRERMIVRARFGMDPNTKSQTLLKVAEKMGISKERVRQLEQRALGKLRKMAEAGHLRAPEDYYAVLSY